MTPDERLWLTTGASALKKLQDVPEFQLLLSALLAPELPPPPPPPPLPAPSPHGTLVPPAASITDEVGDVWTISDSALLRNGQAGWPGAYRRLAWCEGTFYILSDGGQWYRLDQHSPALVWSPAPPPACLATIPPTFAEMDWDHSEDGQPLPSTVLDRTVTFEDDFTDARMWIDPGDTVAHGAKWFAGTQGGPYGLANVGYGVRNDVYTQAEPGVLGIIAHRTDGVAPTAVGGWYSGHLQSVGIEGQGFAQAYGYFEARMKFPMSYMAWPAFWLKHRAKWVDPLALNIELDVIEWYGPTDPQRQRHTIHLGPGPNNVPPRVYHGDGGNIPVDVSADFHTYGALLDETWIRIYFDRVCVGRFPMTNAFRQPLYPQLTLSVNGHPNELPHAEEAHNPMVLLVDYVRVWAHA